MNNKFENYIIMRQATSNMRPLMSEKYRDRYDNENAINDLYAIKEYIDSELDRRFALLQKDMVVTVTDKATPEIEKIINSIKNVGK